MKVGLNTKSKRRQTIAALFLSLLMLSRASFIPTLAFASTEEATDSEASSTPKAPSAPSAPSAPTAPSAPSAPSAPAAPEAPKAPAAPPAPAAPTSSNTKSTSADETSSSSETGTAPTSEQSAVQSPTTSDTTKSSSTGESSSTAPASSASTPSSTSQSSSQNSGVNKVGQTGNTIIATGDANLAGNSVVAANTNISSNEVSNGSTTVNTTQSSIQPQIDNNGANSNNNASINVADSQNTNQNNQASVNNGLDLEAATGDNKASMNVGNSAIVSGDANVTGTIMNTVNTNVDGVKVAEFNVIDNHTGDLILDYDQNCIIGCTPAANTSATIANNGANSTNTTDGTYLTKENTFQNNDANVTNDMVLVADTGSNQASLNTSGDSVIQTGDANVVANVINLLNTNVAGEVLIGVVNIFGDLVGDIIVPISETTPAQANGDAGATTAAITDNGAQSTNSITVDNVANSNTFQTNDATIENNLTFTADSGGNETNYNTGGNSAIVTGDVNVDAQAATVANTNVSGGTWYLVLINNAGEWIGQIIGAPEDSQMAMGTYSPDGEGNGNGSQPAGSEISGNGAQSNNSHSQTSESNSTTSQSNQANLVNNINLAALTGNNQASYNTGGNSIIMTGDANIVVNLLNIVNTNIASNGRLVVTFINIFGSWTGDFLPPGVTKPTETADPTDHIGGGIENPTVNESKKTITKIKTVEDETEDESQVMGVYSKTSASNQGRRIVRYITTSRPRSGAVLGAMTEAPQLAMNQVSDVLTSPEKKTVRVNLAWLLTLMPLGPLAFILRRTYFS